MAKWQDIKALKECIYDEVEEYLSNSDAYDTPALQVYLDENDTTYKAVVDNGFIGTEDEGIYPIDELIRLGDDGNREPDIDRIDEIANSWIFLD